jgi:hypothetical protein
MTRLSQGGEQIKVQEGVNNPAVNTNVCRIEEVMKSKGRLNFQLLASRNVH